MICLSPPISRSIYGNLSSYKRLCLDNCLALVKMDKACYPRMDHRRSCCTKLRKATDCHNNNVSNVSVSLWTLYKQQQYSREGGTKSLCFLYFLPVGKTCFSRSLLLFHGKNRETTKKRIANVCGHLCRYSTRNVINSVAFPILSFFWTSCILVPGKTSYKHYNDNKKSKWSLTILSLSHWITKLIRWLLISSVSLLSFSNTCLASGMETQGLRPISSTKYILTDSPFPSVSTSTNYL